MAILKRKPENPFFLKTNIPDPYFCDREKETKNIISLLQNGNNIVITAERRTGKSSLINHILENKAIKGKYNTLYVDISGTRNPETLINAIRTAFENPDTTTFPAKFRTKMEEITREYSAGIGINFSPINLEAHAKRTSTRKNQDTIDTIFNAIAATEKKNIIVFDEFQQIEKYDEEITAFLRSKIQMMTNSQFIFSGSSVHMLAGMFVRSNMPFYNSAYMFGLKKIPKKTYTDFCGKMFSLYDKTITPEAVDFVYDMYYGNSQSMQQIMNKAFSMTNENETATEQKIKDALNAILEDRNDIYQALYFKMKEGTERNLITCIALEGIASELTSSRLNKQYNLGPSSTVDRSLKKLQGEDLNVIKEIGEKNYSLVDRNFEFWIAQQTGFLEQKLDNIHEAAKMEIELKKKNLPAIFRKK